MLKTLSARVRALAGVGSEHLLDRGIRLDAINAIPLELIDRVRGRSGELVSAYSAGLFDKCDDLVVSERAHDRMVAGRIAWYRGDDVAAVDHYIEAADRAALIINERECSALAYDLAILGAELAEQQGSREDFLLPDDPRFANRCHALDGLRCLRRCDWSSLSQNEQPILRAIGRSELGLDPAAELEELAKPCASPLESYRRVLLARGYAEFTGVRAMRLPRADELPRKTRNLVEARVEEVLSRCRERDAIVL